MQTTSEQQQTASEQALIWLVKIQSGQFSQQEHTALKQWINQCAEHQQAFTQAAHLWQDLGFTDELIFSAQMNTAPPPRFAGLKRYWHKLLAACQHLVPRLTPVVRRPLLATLTLACVGIGSYLLLPQQAVPSLYKSGYAANQQITLSDGSVITLSGSSAVSVLLSKTQRNIELLAGVAHFQVAKDASRPFTVSVQELQVRAIGTAFEVRKDSRIRVSVDEGQVALSAGPATERQTASLLQGQRLEYSHQAGFTAVQPYDASQGLLWRSGRLHYQNTPLSDVLADVNRYRQRPITLGSSNLAKLSITASFSIDESDALIEGLQVTHQLRARQAADRVLLLE
ncbi:FecR family protein [Rheinheimera gaetbuli]